MTNFPQLPSSQRLPRSSRTAKALMDQFDETTRAQLMSLVKGGKLWSGADPCSKDARAWHEVTRQVSARKWVQDTTLLETGKRNLLVLVKLGWLRRVVVGLNDELASFFLTDRAEKVVRLARQQAV
jgi:hypothetical protein